MDTFFNYVNSLIFSQEITGTAALIRILLSAVLGVVVGIERQMRHRDAGMRTFTLIATGSTVAMLLSIYLPQSYPDMLNGDPARIAAQVITGIGFLGAGAILRGRGNVQGLTTAACIWQVAAVGLAVGAGLYSAAIIATLVTLFVLISMDRFEQRFFPPGVNRSVIICCKSANPDINMLCQVVTEVGIRVRNHTYSIDFENDKSTVTFFTFVKAQASTDELRSRLSQIEMVASVSLEE